MFFFTPLRQVKEGRPLQHEPSASEDSGSCLFPPLDDLLFSENTSMVEASKSLSSLIQTTGTRQPFHSLTVHALKGQCQEHFAL